MKFRTFLSFLVLVALVALLNPSEEKHRKVTETYVSERQPQLAGRHHTHILQGLTYHSYVLFSIGKLDNTWVTTGYLTKVSVKSHAEKHRKALYPFGDPMASISTK